MDDQDIVPLEDKNEIAALDLLKEQYRECYLVYRQHVTLAWQIPALAFAAFVIVTRFDVSVGPTASGIRQALSSFIVSGFLFLLALHTYRNVVFIKAYTVLLRKIEDRFETGIRTVHRDLKDRLRWWHGVSSTGILAAFLVLVALVHLGISIDLLLSALNSPGP